MFNLINSNDLNWLSDICTEIIKINNSRFSLVERCLHFEKIIVMNKGMETYMRQHIASSSSKIAAGIEFTQLWGFIWSIHKFINKADDLNRFSHDYITHTILVTKDKWFCDKAFKRMQDYVEQDDESGVKTYELCIKLADTFDQYQMYRPDWLASWSKFTKEEFELFENNPLHEGEIKKWIIHASRNNHSLRNLLTDNIWQARLWKLISDEIKNKANFEDNANPNNYLSRSEVISSLCNHKYTKDEIAQLPHQVFIIGISSLPPLVYDFFNVISEHINVFYMLLTPCQDYWGDLSYKDFEDVQNKDSFIFNRQKGERSSESYGDLKNPQTELITADFAKQDEDLDCTRTENQFEYERVEGNSLLLSLGREGKENLACMYDRIENINNTDAFNEVEETSLLNSLKHKLLYLRDDKGRYKIKDNDLSLEIHSCHTIQREVEVLRNAILKKFKDAQIKGENLQPRELLIMVPEIEAYAPYIESVFGGIDKSDKTYIPYAISDRASNNESLLADAVLHLLSCGQTPVTASFITDLLNVGAIAQKFKLSPDDVSLISSWCVNASIHRGLDTQDLSENENVNKKDFLDLPWTFEHGLNRMLDGYALGTDTKTGAYGDIEGADGVVLGKFAEFIYRLKQLKDHFPRELSFFDPSQFEEFPSLKSWFFEEILDKFFEVSSKSDERDLNKIRGHIDKICRVTSEFKNGAHSTSGKISLLVFRRMLEKALANEHDSLGYLREKMNFCSMIPMRAVPFKHIFIMGLNDVSFPRKSNVPGFNLLASSLLRRRGDRSQAVDDRYIFLEAVLSAKESLYLSYLGQNPIDQSLMYPSSVVLELLDYIADNFTLENMQDLPLTELREKLEDRLIKKEHLNNYDIKNYENTKNTLAYPSFDKKSFVIPNTKKEQSPYLALGCNFNVELPRSFNLNLDELFSFLSRPAFYFLRNSLKMDIRSFQQDLPQDEESFNLDLINKGNLVSDALKSALVENIDPFSQIEETLLKEAKTGSLPYGVFLDKEKHNLNDIISLMIEKIESLNMKFSFDKEPFTLAPISTLNHEGLNFDITLEGEIPQFQVVLNPYSKQISPKRLIKAYILGLVSKLLDKSVSEFYIIDIEKIYRVNIPSDKKECLNDLKEFLTLYLRGQFIPQACGDAFLKKTHAFKNKKEELSFEEFSSKNFIFDSYANRDEQCFLFSKEENVLKDKLLFSEVLSYANFYVEKVFNACEELK